MTLASCSRARARDRGLFRRARDALAPAAAAARCPAIAYDSRAVDAGAVFVALRGLHADGAAFAPQAIARGAVAVVSETPAPAGVDVPWVQVERRAARAGGARRGVLRPSEPRAARSSASPAPTARRRPRTCSPSIFEAAGVTCGRIGTVGYRIGDHEAEAARTTPEAPDLQRAAARDGRPRAAAPA